MSRRARTRTAARGRHRAGALASRLRQRQVQLRRQRQGEHLHPLPHEWKVFTANGDGVRPGRLPGHVESVWHVSFDASTKPSVENTTAIDALPPASVDKPVGQLQIYNVQGSFNQELSLSTARSTVLGIDPLGVPDDVKDLVEIVSYTPIATDGLQGSRVVYNLTTRASPGRRSTPRRSSTRAATASTCCGSGARRPASRRTRTPSARSPPRGRSYDERQRARPERPGADRWRASEPSRAARSGQMDERSDGRVMSSPPAPADESGGAR